MNPALVISKREIRAYFNSPVAYIVVTAFAVVGSPTTLTVTNLGGATPRVTIDGTDSNAFSTAADGSIVIDTTVGEHTATGVGGDRLADLGHLGVTQLAAGAGQGERRRGDRCGVAPRGAPGDRRQPLRQSVGVHLLQPIHQFGVQVLAPNLGEVTMFRVGAALEASLT